MKQVTGSPAAKLVLAKLADNSNEQGICWPSIELIVEHTELGQSTVYKHLAALEGLKLIRPVEIIFDGVLKKGFQLSVPGADISIPPRGKQKVVIPPGGKSAPRHGKTIPPGGIPYKEEPSVEPSGNHHSDAREVSEEGFAPIWAAFQTWPGLLPSATEARARRAHGQMRAELPPDLELIACIRAQGRAFVEENARRGQRLGKVIPVSPHNWLERDKGWKSFLETVRAEPERLAAAAAKSAAARAGLPPSVLVKLKAQGIDDALIDAWFDGVVFEHGPPPRLTVTTEFKRTYIRSNFRSKLERALGADVVVDLAESREAA